MDYCYQCRRTLNGALVCPGCGAYAPDIAPPPAAYGGDAGPASAAGHAAAPWESHGHQPHASYPPGPYGGAPYPDPALEQAALQAATALFDAPDAPGADEPFPDDDPLFGDGPSTESVLGPASIAPTLHRGRAARRRQMERWKKNRRRAAAATAVALFGGGVTVASMQSHSGKGSTTASATDTPVVPLSLHTDGYPGHSTDGSTHTVAADVQHAGTTAARPDVHVTYPSTDSVSSLPRSVIPSSRPVSYTVTTRSAPAATPAPSTTTAPAAPSGSGTAAPAGSTADGSTSAGAPSGGSGSTTAATPAQQSTQSGTSTASTPPRNQLCLLIVCLG